MPRRTLHEARQLFEEEVLPRASDFWRREFEGQLESAESEAKERAAQRIEGEAAQILEARTEALRALAGARDGYEELVALGKQGELTAREYTRRLDELHRQEDDAEALLSDAEEKLGYVEAIEQDPIGWFDDLARRHPQVQREFSW